MELGKAIGLLSSAKQPGDEQARWSHMLVCWSLLWFLKFLCFHELYSPSSIMAITNVVSRKFDIEVAHEQTPLRAATHAALAGDTCGA